jgi:hypothetical protein
MISLRATILLLAGAALVTACGKGGQTPAPAPNATAQTAAPAATASGAETVITADQLPVLKAGYWETTTTSNGGHPEVSHTCASGKPLDTRLFSHDCSQFTIKRNLTGGFVMDGACGHDGASSTMHVAVQGDFLGGGYTSDGKMTMTIPNHGTMSFVTHSVAKYLGPCPAGSEASN